MTGVAARLRANSAHNPGKWLLIIVMMPVLLAFGVGLSISCASEGLPQGVIFGAFVAGIAAVGGAGLLGELRLVLRRPGPIQGSSPDGRVATVVRRPAWFMPLTVGMLLVIGGAPLASGVFVLFDEEYAPLAVFMLPLGLWLMSYFVPILRGQVRGGGVYLTPEGVYYVKHGGWWRADWDDIAVAARREPVSVLLESGRTGECGRTSRWGWKGEVNTGTPAVLGIETRHLAVGPTSLAEVINLCKLNPELRAELGTPAALAWPAWRLEATPAPERARRADLTGYTID